MPSNRRPRSGSGPGRGTPRTRASSRPQATPRTPRRGGAVNRPGRNPESRSTPNRDIPNSDTPNSDSDTLSSDTLSSDTESTEELDTGSAGAKAGKSSSAKSRSAKGGEAKKRAAYLSTSRGTTATDSVPAGPSTDERSERGLGVTRRAIALFVVLAILAISYASSLRIYLDTERANATNQQSIAQSQERIDDLNAELVRWDDPDYVRAQARERLGWVQPGDTGYRAIGPDGKPYGHQIDTVGSQPQTNEQPAQWWSKMWGSVRTADQPAPIPEPVNKPEPPPITISGAPPATPSATKKP